MRISVAVGAFLGLISFLAWQGFDITPVLVLAAISGLFYLILRRDLSGLGTKKRFRIAADSRSKQRQSVSFADIGGQEAAKREFLEALDFIKNEAQVKKLGIRPLKGILLTGPPGTGKTMLAKAGAHYTQSVFISASGSEFVEMYAGVGAQRVRKLFQEAREAARRAGKNSAVIFIDELEVLGGKRGTNTNHHEYGQTLNQLLVEMDGIASDEDVRVLVLGATNRPDLLDDALMRPGRFDRIVKVELPDRLGRLEILKIHVAGKPVDPEVDLDQLARETFGFSGAHLESLVNEAAILAMREQSKTICNRHFREAVDKVILGEKLDRRPGPDELERIALHESGHAIASELAVPGSVSSVTITSRGKALGYMRQAPRDDQYLYTKADLANQIKIALAGAVAEELMLGMRSTGCQNDLQQAVGLAKQMIASGMSELGTVILADLPETIVYRTVHNIVGALEDEVRRELTERRDILRCCADRLLAEEKISGSFIRELIQQNSSAA
ncbi:MAG: AAA family ATPase [Firmicutes bacterium]|nr:AAA family ATPase [Bacillota bacterium]